MMSKYKRLRSFIGDEVYYLYLVALAVGFLTFVVEVSFVYVLQGFLVSIGLLPVVQTFLPSWYPQGILASSLIFSLFGFLRAVSAFLRYFLTGITSQAFMRHQRTKILEYSIYNSSKLSMHEVASVFGDRIANASYVLNKLSDLTIIVTSLICLSLFGLRLAPIELFLGCFLLFCIVLPLSKFNHIIARVGESLTRTTVNVNATILIAIKNNFFLKVHGLVEQEIKRGTEYLRRYEKEFRIYQWIGALRSVIPSFVGILLVAAISFISIQFIHTPAMKLVSFFYIFIRLAQGASDAYSAIGEVLLHRISLKIIFDWSNLLDKLRQEPSHSSNRGLKATTATLDRVEYKVSGLGFEYEPGVRIFSDLSFTLKKGEILLIRGPSGVGKSSLLAILMGVNPPTTGAIYLNDQPLEKNVGALQNSLAFVGPEPFLKPGTIRENLLYGHPNPESVSTETILQALEVCHMRELISAYKEGVDEYLYEFAQLSTGQKQRLSLTRALLRKPQLLVLDEATANLDKDTEEDIIRSLTPLMKEMTVVIVSHKETFNYLATHVIKLGSD